MKNLLFIIVAALAFGLGWCSHSSLPLSDKTVKFDTIQGKPVIVTEVKVDTLYLLAPIPYLAWVDHKDTIYRGDSCWHLREYKEYQDSAYYAKVSGVNPRLDEIRVYPKTVYEKQYIYRDIVSKPKRWGVGVSAGYGISKHGLSPVLAVTVNYNLWNF